MTIYFYLDAPDVITRLRQLATSRFWQAVRIAEELRDGVHSLVMEWAKDADGLPREPPHRHADEALMSLLWQTSAGLELWPFLLLPLFSRHGRIQGGT